MNLIEGKFPLSPQNALDIHVPAGLAAYTHTGVFPSPLQYARYLLFAGIVIAVFYCLFTSSNVMAQEKQGVNEIEIDDAASQEEVPVVDGLAVLSLNNEAACGAVQAVDGPAPGEAAAMQEEVPVVDGLAVLLLNNEAACDAVRAVGGPAPGEAAAPEQTRADDWLAHDEDAPREAAWVVENLALGDGAAPEEDPVADGLTLLSFNNEDAREAVRAVNGPAPGEAAVPDETTTDNRLALVDDSAQEETGDITLPVTEVRSAEQGAIPDTCLQVTFQRGSLLSHKVRAFFEECTEKTVFWKLGNPGEYVDYHAQRDADIQLRDGEQDVVKFLRDRFGIETVYDNQNQVYFYDE